MDRYGDPEKHEALQGDVSTDVLVIGGGLCGILCTYFLKKAGVDCLLVEGEEIAGGMTKNTTAKITSQHGLVYDGLIRTLGGSGPGSIWRPMRRGWRSTGGSAGAFPADLRRKPHMYIRSGIRRCWKGRSGR